MNKIERKVRHAYLKNLSRVCSAIPLSEPLTKEGFDKMWNANFFYIASPKVSDKIHNTAANLVEENFLRPIGVRMGYLK